jgi:DNA polymerase III epsilon subunit-like protein
MTNQIEDELDVALDEPPPAETKPDHYLIIDTETSGVFDFKRPADDPDQPRLAELVMIFVDKDLVVEQEYQAYIRPDGWEMSPGASAVNKLTTEMLMEKGVPIDEVLDGFCMAVKDEGRVVVAHNAQFDLKQMRAELRRAGRDDLFHQTRNICTMRALTDVCKIPPSSGRGGYKFPKLSEACVFFNFDQFGDHTALNDARATLALFRKMREIGKIIEPKVHLAKEKP